MGSEKRSTPRVPLSVPLKLRWSGSDGKVKEEQKQDRQTTQDVKAKVGVIEEQTKRTQEDVKEIKETQKDTNRKLDELLRRR